MYLAVAAILGLIAAIIASNKGRNVVGWFFVGFLLGLIGVIIAAVMPNLKKERAKEKFAEQERRRLREQLRQERLKTEAFRQYSTARLDAHDQHLGIDTHTASSLPNTIQKQALPSQGQGNDAMDALLSQVQSPSPVAMNQKSDWYYDSDGKPIGPLPESDIYRLIQNGRIQKHTLLWTAGYDDWVSAGEVDQFHKGWGS